MTMVLHHPQAAMTSSEPEVSSSGFFVVAARDLTAACHTALQFSLFNPKEDGFGILRKLQAHLRPVSELFPFELLGIWLAFAHGETQPRGMAMVYRASYRIGPFERRPVTVVDVYVVPESRRQGLGRRLAEAATAAFPWAAAYHTEDAYALYEALGLPDVYVLSDIQDEIMGPPTAPEQLVREERYRRALRWWTSLHPNNIRLHAQVGALIQGSLERSDDLYRSYLRGT